MAKTVIISTTPGLSGHKISWMRTKQNDEFWCRMPVAMFGSFNMSNEDLDMISPFDKKFNDNYVEGKGKTKEEALDKMKKNMNELCDSLWV